MNKFNTLFPAPTTPQSFDMITAFKTFRTYLSVSQGVTPPTWFTELFANQLDLEYFYNHSGDKIVTPLVEHFLDSNNTFVDTQFCALMYIAYNKFINKWNRLHSAIDESTYNPIENYDSTETRTPNLTFKDDSSTNAKQTSSGYGFGSQNANPISESNANKLDNTYTNERKETGTETIARHGNIGVTTSQQMLESEIALRNNYVFQNVIMNDLDSLFCLQIYI